MTQETKAVTPEDERMIKVNDLDTFVKFLVGWHNHQVKELDHLMTIPEGVTVNMPVKDGEEAIPDIVLTGDVRKAFLIGLFTAKSLLGKLPFKAEFEDVEAANDEQPQEADPA